MKINCVCTWIDNNYVYQQNTLCNFNAFLPLYKFDICTIFPLFLWKKVCFFFFFFAFSPVQWVRIGGINDEGDTNSHLNTMMLLLLFSLFFWKFTWLISLWRLTHFPLYSNEFDGVNIDHTKFRKHIMLVEWTTFRNCSWKNVKIFWYIYSGEKLYAKGSSEAVREKFGCLCEWASEWGGKKWFSHICHGTKLRCQHSPFTPTHHSFSLIFT